MKLLKKVLSAVLSVGMIFGSAFSTNIFADSGKKAVEDKKLSIIPETLEESCIVLDEMLSDEEKEKVKTIDLVNFHMGLGLWVRNNWIYPCEEDRITKLLKDNGCADADEMSAIILINYRHYLLTGESTANIKNLVIDYWFEFWSRFKKDLKREEIQEKIEKTIRYNNMVYRKKRTVCLCTIL